MTPLELLTLVLLCWSCGVGTAFAVGSLVLVSRSREFGDTLDRACGHAARCERNTDRILQELRRVQPLPATLKTTFNGIQITQDADGWKARNGQEVFKTCATFEEALAHVLLRRGSRE